MKKVILYTQNHSKVASMTAQPEGEKAMYDGISDAVARLAEKIDADVIVCQTASGTTALTMAAQRPNVPIISVTPNPRVANQLALTYANSAFVRKYDEHFGRDLALELKDSGYLQTKPGKKDLLAVIVSGDKNKFGTDTIKIRHI